MKNEKSDRRRSKERAAVRRETRGARGNRICGWHGGDRLVSATVAALLTAGLCTVPAFAAGDPIQVVNNLSSFIFGLIRAVGIILLGWGIVQVGMSLQSHDPSQRSNGFLTLAGGIVITFAREILDLIIG